MEKKYYRCSCSFGKDSLALLLKLIELKMPLDEVVFYDTGMEFEAIYNIRDRVKKLLQENNIKYIELKPKCEMYYSMFEKIINAGKPNEHKGYSWCGGCTRWGTTEKLQALEKYGKNCIDYVGIAGDEWKRLEAIFEFDMETYKDKNGKEKKRPLLNENGCIQNYRQIAKFNKKYPLVEWNMNEQDCLKYCHDKGFYWWENDIELYSILDRVSCWCCANKNLTELRNYWLYLPKYWEMLKNFQRKTDRPFKPNLTIFDLEDMFEMGYIPRSKKHKS